MPEPANSALDDARKRARRRLVGAIVLALGAAVVVPVFLESDPKPLGPDVQIQIPAVDDAKFQNRLTPQQKGPATDKATQAAPAGAKQPEPASAAAAKQADPASTASAKQADSSVVPGRAAAAATVPAPKGDNAAPAGAVAPETKSATKATSPETASQSTPTAAPQAASAADSPPKTAPKQVEKKPAPPKKAATPATTEQAPATNLGTATLNTAPPAPSKSGEFVVQIGAFVDKTVATDLATKAGEQGFPVFLEGVTTKNGPVQRVRVGPFPNKAAADAAAAKLIAAGFTAEARPR